MSSPSHTSLLNAQVPIASLPPWPILDPLLQAWLAEDIGRGDRATQALCCSPSPDANPLTTAVLRLKQDGVIAGLSLFERIFDLLEPNIAVAATVTEGQRYPAGTTVAHLQGPMAPVLTGERVALKSDHASEWDCHVDSTLYRSHCRLTDPAVRHPQNDPWVFASSKNMRRGLGVRLTIAGASTMRSCSRITISQQPGALGAAITQARRHMPMPLTLEVETETLDQVQAALAHAVDIIMLDNMSPETMVAAVTLIRQRSDRIKIEASGNITLDTIRTVAETGVDYISTSAPITQARWLDLSLKLTIQQTHRDPDDSAA